MLFVVPDGNAQGAIEYGSNLTATISELGEKHEYTFEGSAGDRIFLRMRGLKNGVDGCFYLHGPGGALLASDCSDGRLVEIKDFELPGDGVYTVKTQDRKDNDTGIYGLSLQVLNRTDPDIPRRCEAEYNANLDNLAEVDSYELDIEAGDVVLLQMRSIIGDIEPVIELYNTAGDLVKRATAKAGLSRIGAIYLEEAGSYMLLAFDENGNDLGEYNVSIQFVNVNECAALTGCGADFSAELEKIAEIDAYVFDAVAGDVIVAHMRGNNNSIEPLMELYDPEGALVATNKRIGKLGKLSPTTLTKTGKYILLAMDEVGNDKGTYSMAFQFTNASVAIDCSVPLHCSNMTETRRLSADAEIDAYTFFGEVGDQMSIEVVEIDSIIEPRFELYAPNGSFVTSASSGAKAEKENVELVASGYYTLLVMDYEGNDEGRYSFNIQGNAIKDVIAPNVVCQDITVTIGDDGVAEITPADIDAGSTDDCGIESIELSKSVFTCDDKGVQTVSLIITDGGGNVSACEAIITIEDPNIVCGWDYCESYATSTDYEWIQEVKIGGIVNNSGNDGGYGDYTDMITDFNVNSSTVVEFSPGFANPANPLRECWAIWIDFNFDGDFDDEGEKIFQKSSYGTIYGMITIPDYAYIGKVQMRVGMNYEAYPSACGVYNYGETEDYMINIIPTAICATLPTAWGNGDVGSPELEGSACYDDVNGTYTLEAAGGDIYNKADQFHFAYQEFCGDGEIIARVIGLKGEAEYGLGGIMVREGLDAGARNVALLGTRNNGIYFQARKKTNKNTKSGAIDATTPMWMKLVREGNTVQGYLSKDGLEWGSGYSTSISNLDECLLFGLATTSNNTSVYNTAVFDNVMIQESSAFSNGDDSSIASVVGEEEGTTETKLEIVPVRIAADLAAEMMEDSEEADDDSIDRFGNGNGTVKALEIRAIKIAADLAAEMMEDSEKADDDSIDRFGNGNGTIKALEIRAIKIAADLAAEMMEDSEEADDDSIDRFGNGNGTIKALEIRAIKIAADLAAEMMEDSEKADDDSIDRFGNGNGTVKALEIRAIKIAADLAAEMMEDSEEADDDSIDRFGNGNGTVKALEIRAMKIAADLAAEMMEDSEEADDDSIDRFGNGNGTVKALEIRAIKIAADLAAEMMEDSEEADDDSIDRFGNGNGTVKALEIIAMKIAADLAVEMMEDSEEAEEDTIDRLGEGGETVTALEILPMRIAADLAVEMMEDSETPDQTIDRNGEIEGANINVIIYPNPAVEYARIEFPELEVKLSELSIYNSLGQRVWQQQLEENETAVQIDLRDSRFLSGQYWVQIQTSSGPINKPLLIVR